MSTHVIRYRLKPECAADNESLVKQVFAALHRARPQGLRYTCFKSADGLNYMHVVSHGSPDSRDVLTSLPEFKAFSSGVAQRCEEPPQRVEMAIVGAYGAFDDTGS